MVDILKQYVYIENISTNYLRIMNKKQILKLAETLGEMKALKRQGWVRRRVQNPESDADHSYSLAMLVMLLAPKNLNLLKCMQLALVHDLPEIYCGDIVPGELDLQKKFNLEAKAMQEVVKNLECPQLQELFMEYELRTTPEARFVWALDRLDNVFTAKKYEDAGYTGLVEEFAASARERIESLEDDSLREYLSQILDTLTA